MFSAWCSEPPSLSYFPEAGGSAATAGQRAEHTPEGEPERAHNNPRRRQEVTPKLTKIVPSTSKCRTVVLLRTLTSKITGLGNKSG